MSDFWSQVTNSTLDHLRAVFNGKIDTIAEKRHKESV